MPLRMSVRGLKTAIFLLPYLRKVSISVSRCRVLPDAMLPMNSLKNRPRAKSDSSPSAILKDRAVRGGKTL